MRSFGYGHAAPDEEDLVVDLCRFRNVPDDKNDADALIHKNGQDKAVREFALGTPGLHPTLDEVADQGAVLAARASGHGRYTVIQIGCGGGRHRSVAGAEYVAALLRSRGTTTEVEHRDVDRPILAPNQEGRDRAEQVTVGAGAVALALALATLLVLVLTPGDPDGPVWWGAAGLLTAATVAVSYTPRAVGSRTRWCPRLQAQAVAATAWALTMTSTTGAALCGLAAWVAVLSLPPLFLRPEDH